VIGFGHIWDNQTTFSKLRTLSAVPDKLQIFATNYCSMIIERLGGIS
jgi:hypothetical protein